MRKLTAVDMEQALIVGRRFGKDGSKEFFEAATEELNYRLDDSKQLQKEDVFHILDHIYFDDSLGRGELGTRHGAVLRNYLMPGWLEEIAKELTIQLKSLLS